MIRWAAAHREKLLLGLILAAGAALRFYGLNWDGGHWLHPDERQIYFVTSGLQWPERLADALRPGSPLNPHFFAYGSFPFYLLRFLAWVLAPLGSALGDPDNLHWIGRPLAALFDLGTVLLTYHLAHVVLAHGGHSQEARAARSFLPLVAAALVSLATLHVQASHFYTADPILTFLVMGVLYSAARVAQGGHRRHRVGLGVGLGLALATKISAAPLALVILVAHSPVTPTTKAAQRHRLRQMLGTAALAGVTFVLAQPYAIIDAPTFMHDTLREAQIAWGTLDVPYTRQYAGALPYLYSMGQLALWGLALPVGLLAWAGFIASAIRWLRRAPWTDTLLLAWAGPTWLLVGLWHARPLRYLLPLVPVLCILACRLLQNALQSPGVPGNRRPNKTLVPRALVWVMLLASLGYALAFASIYQTPHTWVAASEWIYRQIPARSTLAVEDWDTALPLPLEVNGQPRRIEEYDLRVLTLYDEPDDGVKWEALAADLASSNYLIVASRRLYGSIPRLPDRYPLASQYYPQLFQGRLGFDLVAEFARGPGWLNPQIPPLANTAPALFRPDESLVVYDHPRTLIYRNSEHLTPDELLRRISGQ